MNLFRRLLDKNKSIPPLDHTEYINKKKKVLLNKINTNKTPLYFYFNKIINDRYQELDINLKQYWPGPHQIAYSFKTNYDIAQFSQIKKLGAWAEVVSEKEYNLALELGYRGNQIVYNGPNKTQKSLSQAIVNQSLINIDHLEEIDEIASIAKQKSLTAKVGIRINTKIKNINQSHFGFSIDNNEAINAVNKILKSKQLSLIGIHIHIGTDIDQVDNFLYASKKVTKFINTLYKNYNLKLEYIDMGGGFPSSSKKPFCRKHWSPKPIGSYISAICFELSKAFSNTALPQLIVEPGRYLSDDSAIFVTKVLSTKHLYKQQKVITDGSITMLPLSLYRSQTVNSFSQKLFKKNTELTSTVIYGASCREDDRLYTGPFNTVQVGDFIVYSVVGAYNQNLTGDFIFEKPKFYFI